MQQHYMMRLSMNCVMCTTRRSSSRRHFPRSRRPPTSCSRRSAKRRRLTGSCLRSPKAASIRRPRTPRIREKTRTPASHRPPHDKSNPAPWGASGCHAAEPAAAWSATRRADRDSLRVRSLLIFIRPKTAKEINMGDQNPGQGGQQGQGAPQKQDQGGQKGGFQPDEKGSGGQGDRSQQNTPNQDNPPRGNQGQQGGQNR